MGADDGLSRRFPEQPENYFRFDDYTPSELSAIFVSFLDVISKNCPDPAITWKLEHKWLADVVGRRVARGAGRRGFGNAGSVEGLLKGPILSRNAARMRIACRTASGLSRQAMFTLTQADVLGTKPDPAESPAFRKLEVMVGLHEVKKAMHSLLLQMAAMWDADMAGQEPQEVPRLNRLFLGPPGTGKVSPLDGRSLSSRPSLLSSSFHTQTTVAELYGEILAECGFLSNGEVLLKTPVDFIAGYIGQSETKTAALLERAKGRVLIIDEAYGLDGSTEFHSAVMRLWRLACRQRRAPTLLSLWLATGMRWRASFAAPTLALRVASTWRRRSTSSRIAPRSCARSLR
jgi:hypothetical protein